VNILETQWWSMCLPPEWWAEQDEESILVGDCDDVGCIEISTLVRDDGEFSSPEVREIASQQHEIAPQWEAVNVASMDGLYASFIEEDTAVREWYLGAGKFLIFISYSCALENRNMDDSAVNEILATLVVDIE
jgi:hypothetical protein